MSESPSTVAATKAAVAAATKKAQIAALNAKIAALSFFGLNKDGLPTGFSVTDSKNVAGVGRVTKGVTTVGADGIIVEVHPDPEKAVSDGAQSLKPEKFYQLMDDVRAIALAMRH